MEKKNVVPHGITIVGRDLPSSHRGYDIRGVFPLEKDIIKFVCDSLFHASKMEIPVSDGNKCWVTDQPWDPKIIPVQNMRVKQAVRLVGNILEYKDKHGDCSDTYFQERMEATSRFDAIATEIVKIFWNTWDTTEQSLRSPRGVRISLDSLQNSFGIASASLEGKFFLPSCQKAFALQRDNYLKFLTAKIQTRLLLELRYRNIVKENENIQITLKDDHPNGGKSARFTIVTEQKSRDTTTLP